MRAVKQGLLVAVLAICCLGLAPMAKPEPAADVKWARGIVDDFWKAVFTEQQAQAAGLLSPELSRALVTLERDIGSETKATIAWPATKWLQETLPYGADCSVTIDSQEIQPGQAEVVFTGRFSGTDYWGKKVAAKFKMRVAREGAAGKWCIRFLLITESKIVERRTDVSR